MTGFLRLLKQRKSTLLHQLNPYLGFAAGAAGLAPAAGLLAAPAGADEAASCAAFLSAGV